MKEVEVTGTIKDVANVITSLMNDEEGEVLIVGEAVEEVSYNVIRTLTDFKVTFTENKLDNNKQFIKVFD